MMPLLSVSKASSQSVAVTARPVVIEHRDEQAPALDCLGFVIHRIDLAKIERSGSNVSPSKQESYFQHAVREVSWVNEPDSGDRAGQERERVPSILPIIEVHLILGSYAVKIPCSH